jgi:hypothetical protein
LLTLVGHSPTRFVNLTLLGTTESCQSGCQPCPRRRQARSPSRNRHNNSASTCAQPGNKRQSKSASTCAQLGKYRHQRGAYKQVQSSQSRFWTTRFRRSWRCFWNDRNSTYVNTWYNGGGMEWGVAVLFCTRSNYRVLHNQLGPLTPITKTNVFYHTKHTTILLDTIVSLYVISLPSLAL